MKPVAVEGCVFEVKDGAIVTVCGTPTISPASTKVKIGGKGVYFDQMTVTYAPGTIVESSFSNVNPVVFTISPQCQKVRVGGQKAILEGDTASAEGVSMLAPPSTTKVVVLDLTIKSAGQSKISAN